MMEVIKDKMASIKMKVSLDGYCRLCSKTNVSLLSPNVKLVDQSKCTSHEPKYRRVGDVVNMYLQIELLDRLESLMPRNVCIVCTSHILQWEGFLEMCRRSHKFFESILSRDFDLSRDKDELVDWVIRNRPDASSTETPSTQNMVRPIVVQDFDACRIQKQKFETTPTLQILRTEESAQSPPRPDEYILPHEAVEVEIPVHEADSETEPHCSTDLPDNTIKIHQREIHPKSLIQLVKQRPLIYSTKRKDHKIQAAIDRLWKEIGTELNQPAAECKVKWGNLRCFYNRVIRENRNWHLKKEMDFLREFVGGNRSLRIVKHYEKTQMETVESELADRNTKENLTSSGFLRNEEIEDLSDHRSQSRKRLDALKKKKENLLFVSLIQKRPPLYNYNLKGPRRQPILHQLWKEVATEMEMPVYECIIKWRKLQILHAQGLADKWNWYLMEAMEFLKDKNSTSGTANAYSEENTMEITEPGPAGANSEGDLTSPVVYFDYDDSDSESNRKTSDTFEQTGPVSNEKCLPEHRSPEDVGLDTTMLPDGTTNWVYRLKKNELVYVLESYKLSSEGNAYMLRSRLCDHLQALQVNEEVEERSSLVDHNTSNEDIDDCDKDEHETDKENRRKGKPYSVVNEHNYAKPSDKGEAEDPSNPLSTGAPSSDVDALEPGHLRSDWVYGMEKDDLNEALHRYGLKTYGNPLLRKSRLFNHLKSLEVQREKEKAGLCTSTEAADGQGKSDESTLTALSDTMDDEHQRMDFAASPTAADKDFEVEEFPFIKMEPESPAPSDNGDVDNVYWDEDLDDFYHRPDRIKVEPSFLSDEVDDTNGNRLSTWTSEERFHESSRCLEVTGSNLIASPELYSCVVLVEKLTPAKIRSLSNVHTCSQQVQKRRKRRYNRSYPLPK